MERSHELWAGSYQSKPCVPGQWKHHHMANGRGLACQDQTGQGSQPTPLSRQKGVFSNVRTDFCSVFQMPHILFIACPSHVLFHLSDLHSLLFNLSFFLILLLWAQKPLSPVSLPWGPILGTILSLRSKAWNRIPVYVIFGGSAFSETSVKGGREAGKEGAGAEQ